jgi:hypothetical protein
MREENEAPPPAALFQEEDDPNARALFAVSHLLRWLVDGTGIEARVGKPSRRHNQNSPMDKIAKKAVGLVLVARPDHLREQVLRKLARECGCSHVSLGEYAQLAEAEFGYLVAKRGRATRPHFEFVTGLRNDEAER